MNKQRMIEWIATCDTGVSSMTMWSALMGVKRKKDLDIPKDNRDFRRCYDMVEYGHVTLDELQVVKKQYPWFAPVVDNWKEIMDILEGKNEFVRDANGNEELASRICNYALDSILVENPDLALRKRLDKEQKGDDAPDGISNVIEIKGDDAKKLVETLCGILYKGK